MANPSALILVKNESYFLPYVLKGVEDVFDSFVIYDIDSTDNTKEIIDWFSARVDGKADLFVRKMPHCIPDVQGAFRNSMIVEGRRDIYFILDGDEAYTAEDMAKIPAAANALRSANRRNPKKRFGVFKRVEMNAEMTKQYDRRRSHHRLYTRDAFWSGTHPGEVPGYKQNEKSEMWYDLTCFHFHNTLRSPNEAEATRRLQRKFKKSYHPGSLIDLDLLKELPALRERIEDFPVSPALEALWEKETKK